MTLPWYPRDMGKYARDTKHLTMLEHGAYTLMLDHYYSTGGLPPASNATSNASLMLDHSRIYRLCSAMTKPEQDAVDTVLKLFFTVDNDGNYRHEKCDEVIEKQLLKHQKRVEAGRKGGFKQCSSNAQAYKKEKENKTIEDIPPSIPPDGFLDFWMVFPTKRKGSKEKAEQAWRAAIKRGATPEQITKGATDYANSDEVRRGWAKGAAAWLNDDRWGVDYSEPNAKRSGGESAHHTMGRAWAGAAHDHSEPRGD